MVQKATQMSKFHCDLCNVSAMSAAGLHQHVTSEHFPAYHKGLLLPPANEVWGKVMFLHLTVCSQGGSASNGGRPPPKSDITGYGQRAGGTHPTEMHSCFKKNNYCFRYERPFSSYQIYQLFCFIYEKNCIH